MDIIRTLKRKTGLSTNFFVFVCFSISGITKKLGNLKSLLSILTGKQRREVRFAFFAAAAAAAAAASNVIISTSTIDLFFADIRFSSPSLIKGIS